MRGAQGDTDVGDGEGEDAEGSAIFLQAEVEEREAAGGAAAHAARVRARELNPAINLAADRDDGFSDEGACREPEGGGRGAGGRRRPPWPLPPP